MHIMTNEQKIIYYLDIFIASKRRQKNSIEAGAGGVTRGKIIEKNETDAKPSDLLMDS